MSGDASLSFARLIRSRWPNANALGAPHWTSAGQLGEFAGVAQRVHLSGGVTSVTRVADTTAGCCVYIAAR
jgi:hypothetical protein